MRQARRGGWVARFRRDEDGVAAIEFAIIMPLFVFATLAMTDVALRIMTLQKADAEVRLAMEGAMRYGEDIESLRDFVERNGGTNIPQGEEFGKVVAGGPSDGVAVRQVSGCASSDGSVSFHAGTPPCGAYSRWVEILGIRNSTGVLTESQSLRTLNHVRVR